MAYEWYCYINNIEEYKTEYKDIVDYILGNTDGDFVDIILERNYYFAIDQLSEVGTNAFFQYDDIDGYRYVVFDFWKTIAYRVRICKSPNGVIPEIKSFFFELYLYHIDGSKTKTAFGAYPLDGKTKPAFITIKPEDMKIDLWREFMKRIEKIMSTMVLSIYTLKKEVDLISLKLKKYDEGKIDVAQLLGFEENNIVTVIEIISLLHANKDKYDKTKSFNSNLPIILNLRGDTIGRTIEDKEKFIKTLVERDKSKTLSEYIWQGIFTFQEIYGYEMKLINQE